MGDSGAWCLIESDPAVFTELIHDFGVKDVKVSELYSLDDIALPKPVYGLIFLFKWIREEDTREIAEYDPTKLFFAAQRIQNACATQAIISILLNRPEVELGKDLKEFRDFVADFPPDLKGEAITNSDRIRTVHNSFSRLESMMVDEAPQQSESGEAFHFISYVPVNGRLYELDGLKPGPIDLGSCDNEEWVDAARPHIQARMQRYASSEVRFSLMAVTKDPRAIYQEELAKIDAVLGTAVDGATSALLAKQQELKDKIAAEEELAARHALENTRRKHNWLPFIYRLLCLMAEHGKLPSG